MSIFFKVVSVGKEEAEEEESERFFNAFKKSSCSYEDDHWKWHVSRGPVLGANKTREFIIGSLGATRKGGGRNGNDTRVASTVRCNQGELS